VLICHRRDWCLVCILNIIFSLALLVVCVLNVTLFLLILTCRPFHTHTRAHHPHSKLLLWNGEKSIIQHKNCSIETKWDFLRMCGFCMYKHKNFFTTISIFYLFLSEFIIFPPHALSHSLSQSQSRLERNVY
jgi:hypothetical protein